MKLLGILVILVVVVNSIAGSPSRRWCMDYGAKKLDSSFHDVSDDYEDENAEYEDPATENEVGFMPVPGNETHPSKNQCDKSTPYCFTLWMLEANGTNKIITQGCWSSSDKKETCDQESCTGEFRSKYLFCCCSGDLCNVNITTPERIAKPAESVIASNQIPPTPEKSVFDSPLVWISFGLMGGTLMVVIAFVSCQVQQKPEPEESPLAPSGPGYSSNLYNVDNLKLVAMIGRGKYGTVWKGMVNEQPVAVKIFAAHHKQYFLNEKEIYTQPFLDSPALLSYFGCDERRTMDDSLEYMLVLSLAPLGCLQDWLIENTTNFATFCKMASSVARGVSHLHTEIKKGDVTKMCICHRDINSRNILVKADLTCCLCDLGFAMKTYGSRYEYCGEMVLAETKSINEVGTLRYMAPEILEGAVNLRDCETSLKQIDVYSLGLCMWELCVRCSDFYPSEQTTPAYKAPYEAETGVHPSFEQMQVLVSRHKARPMFPASWGGGPAAKVAKETCEDCWDHDAEARLTSLCVEERLNEISMLKPRATSSLTRGSNTPLSTNNLIPSSPSPAIVSISPMRDTIIITTTSFPPPNQIIPGAQINENTAETPLSSPHNNNNNLKNREMFSQQIQPFQGRNLCMERNLAQIHNHSSSGDEKPLKKCQNGVNVNINSSIHNDNYYEDEVIVEEFLNRNIPTTTIIQTNMETLPKCNNSDQKQHNRWLGVREMIQRKFLKRNQSGSMIQHKSGTDHDGIQQNRIRSPTNKNIHLNLIESHQNSVPSHSSSMIPYGDNMKMTQNQHQKPNNIQRPNNLDISPIIVSRNINNNTIIQQKYRKPPNDDTTSPAFAVIRGSPRIVLSKSANLDSKNLPDESLETKHLKRQRSLDVFRDVFGPPKGSLERLRDVSQRIKTPGDVPPSVRKIRASKTLSLYDDRMMDTSSQFMSFGDGNSV